MSCSDSSNPVGQVVLLIDDDQDDARLIAKQIQIVSTHSVEVRWLSCGVEALQLLRGSAANESAPIRPSLILLDLNMPLMDGFEVLQAIKSDAQLAGIPVVVLSTSDDPHQVAHCYALHANGYVVKPVSLSELRQALEAICRFWLEVAAYSPSSRRESPPILSA